MLAAFTLSYKIIRSITKQFNNTIWTEHVVDGKDFLDFDLLMFCPVTKPLAGNSLSSPALDKANMTYKV